LEKSENLLSFKQKLSDSNLGVLFSDLTGIKTNHSSESVCNNCSEKLKIAWEFKQLCLENDEKYQKLLADNMEVEDKDYLGQNSDFPESKKKHYQRKVQREICSICDKVFVGRYARKCLKAHETRVSFHPLLALNPHINYYTLDTSDRAGTEIHLQLCLLS
jgi:hypothetical protein